MADLSTKNPDNAAGTFYVDENCIDCEECRMAAPENFARNEDAGYSYVLRQPTTPEERKQCESALDACPTVAIGDDGE